MSDTNCRDARGPTHRPEELEICTNCVGLRGPHRGHDNVCACDIEAWKPDEPTRAGDLTNNVIVCQACLVMTVTGSSRWSSFYCDSCRSWVIETGRRLVRCVVPIGRHSLMNGTYWRPQDGPVTDAQVTAFADQLLASFARIDELWELTDRRLRTRLVELGVDGDAISVADYLAQCRERGWSSEVGLGEFAAIVLEREGLGLGDGLLDDNGTQP